MKSAFLLLSLFPLGTPEFSSKNFFKGEFSQGNFLSNPSNNPCQGELQMFQMRWKEVRELNKEVKDEESGLSCSLPDLWGQPSRGLSTMEGLGQEQEHPAGSVIPWEVLGLPLSSAPQEGHWGQLASVGAVVWVVLQKDLH